jgi:Flp pilus assembly protein TadD
VILSTAALLLTAAGAVMAFGRSRVALFAVGWVGLTLLPAANIVFLASRPIAEQRLYMPSFGFCLLLGYGLARLYRAGTTRSGRRRAAAIACLLAALIAGLYAGVTVRRNLDWRDALTLFSRTVAANPDSARMRNNLGMALAEAGRHEEAVSQYLAALRLSPRHPVVCNNLGMALAYLGRYGEAVDYFNEALRLDPDFASVHHNLGMVLLKTGDRGGAIRHFREAVRLKPDYAEVYRGLGAEPETPAGDRDAAAAGDARP